MANHAGIPAAICHIWNWIFDILARTISLVEITKNDDDRIYVSSKLLPAIGLHESVSTLYFSQLFRTRGPSWPPMANKILSTTPTPLIMNNSLINLATPIRNYIVKYCYIRIMFTCTASSGIHIGNFYPNVLVGTVTLDTSIIVKQKKKKIHNFD